MITLAILAPAITRAAISHAPVVVVGLPAGGISGIGRGIDRAISGASTWLIDWWPGVLPAGATLLGVVAAAAVVVRRCLSRRRLRYWHHRARLVTILPHPRSTQAAAKRCGRT